MRIEFPETAAEGILAEHDGTGVDYAVNLWWQPLLTGVDGPFPEDDPLPSVDGTEHPEEDPWTTRSRSATRAGATWRW